MRYGFLMTYATIDVDILIIIIITRMVYFCSARCSVCMLKVDTKHSCPPRSINAFVISLKFGWRDGHVQMMIFIRLWLFATWFLFLFGQWFDLSTSQHASCIFNGTHVGGEMVCCGEPGKKTVCWWSEWRVLHPTQIPLSVSWIVSIFFFKFILKRMVKLIRNICLWIALFLYWIKAVT